jgi:L-arabinose isomerase
MRKAVLSISGNVYKQQEMEIDTALSEIESTYDFTFKEKQLTAIKSIIENKDTIDLCLQTFLKLLLLLTPKITSNRNYSAILATLFAG